MLDAAPGRHRRQDTSVVTALQAKERGTPADLLETWLQAAPYGGLRKEAAQSLGLSDADLSSAAFLSQILTSAFKLTLAEGEKKRQDLRAGG